LFVFFDKDNSNTLSGGEIMSHFFDTKHVEEMIRKVCDEYPDLMKENKPTKTNTPGGRNAQRDPDGKWGVTGGAGMQNRLLNNFLAKIDSILMYRRPDLSNFKRQALTKEYFGSQILHVFGLKHTQEELNVLFNFFDKDGDGTLDYVEVYRRFFAKTRTGRKPEDVGPPKTIYAGQVFKYVAPDEDPVSDEENEEVDARMTQMIQKNLPPLLQGDGQLALVLRKISLAWDQGEWYWEGGCCVTNMWTDRLFFSTLSTLSTLLLLYSSTPLLFYYSPGGSDPLAGLDLRGFRGRNLTKLQFRRQTKRALAVKLTEAEVELIYNAFDADGSGTMEYNEFLLGLKGPLFSALERIRMVLEENRIYRDMRSFKGKNLDPSE
jgi:Ca2+-binding EF-hand superfamily protein